MHVVSFWSTSCAKTVGHCSEKRFGGVGAAEVDPDTAGGDADGGSDFEQVGADGAALGPGVIGGAGLVVAAGKGQSGRKVPSHGRLQTGIGRQSEDKTDVIRFAPGYQIVSATSGITTDDEARSMPAMATTKTLDNGGDRVDAVARLGSASQVCSSLHTTCPVSVKMYNGVEQWLSY